MKVQFDTPQEMLNYINSDRDLYSPSAELYVFNYNDSGSICEYFISNEEAEELKKKSEEFGEYWGAYLGFGGGIYDSIEYFINDGDVNYERCHNCILNGNLNILWCERYYQIDDWEDVTPK